MPLHEPGKVLIASSLGLEVRQTSALMRPMEDDGRGGSRARDDDGDDSDGDGHVSGLVCVNSSQPESAIVHALEVLVEPGCPAAGCTTVVGGLSSGSLMIWRLEGDCLSHVGRLSST